MLLSDIRAVFTANKAERLPSEKLAELLGSLEGRPWAEWKNGKPLTKHQLSRHLRAKYGIVADALDFDGGDGRKKGHRVVDFADAFARYLPFQRNSTRERR